MPTFRLIRVVPALPAKLAALRDLAYNLHWTWDPATVNLFQRLDPVLWETSGGNPVRLLAEVDPKALDAAANDPGFMTQLDRARAALDAHLAKPPTGLINDLNGTRIAYFSLEFGVATCLPIYSGGLGVLAGDHLKSASELGLPLIGIGLHYSRGYFRQYLNSDGWQQEEFADIDYGRLPIVPERRPDGSILAIEVRIAGRTVRAQVWRVQVGRIALYLLDTNVPENTPDDRLITDRLYGGDNETRIQQEIVLGIGGIRLLEALGITTVVCHMNEGHSAFLGLERVRLLMAQRGLSFDEAREIAAAANVFTTHTPVPAGIDLFSPGMIDRYFGDYWPALGLDRDSFLAMGRSNRHDPNEMFSMAVLGIRLSDTVNGVAKLHGVVSRGMWRGLWPDVPETEVPIGSVTNGIHHRSWIAPDLAALYDRYLGTGWWERPADPANWQGIGRIPDEELWRTHERQRERLVTFARERLGEASRATSASAQAIEDAEAVLDPEALTIGFARRFALYKRSTLLFRDPDRLLRLLSDKARPVQILIAGKAHPKDEPAKGLIRQILHLLRRPEFRRRVVFLENYDMTVASTLVQGCDIWLNTPLRPQEASGTSGMKSVVNGGLHCSVLDGWWAEGYQPGVGWAIGGREQYASVDDQDAVESELLYGLLEDEIVPRFYDRTRDGVPKRWVEMMKRSISALSPFFNTDRMVGDYTIRAYVPSAGRLRDLTADGDKRAKALAGWKRSIGDRWNDVRIERVDTADLAELPLGSSLDVTATVHLGAVQPDEVAVEVFVGPVDGRREITQGRTVPLSFAETSDGRAVYRGSIDLTTSGMMGYSVRVVPAHADLRDPYEQRLIRWV